MTIGIPWCRKENYDAFRAIFENRSYPPPTWEEFARHAEAAEKFYQGRGEPVLRVDVDPKEFADWCAENGCGINARACHNFVWQRINPDNASRAST